MNFNEFITLEEAADKEKEIRKKFGRILFGDWQRSERLTRHTEKDTKYERKIFSILYNQWFWNSSWSSTKRNNVLNVLEELSELKDNYPTILKPDPASKYPVLYRALIVKRTDKELKKFHKKLFIQRKNYEIVDEKFGRVVYKLGDKDVHQYTPKREAESWTISFKHAFKFIRTVSTNYGTDYSNAGRPFIIYAAKVPEEERLFKLRFTNKIFETPEYEIVRLSNKPIEASMYYIIHKDELGAEGEDVYEV